MHSTRCTRNIYIFKHWPFPTHILDDELRIVIVLKREWIAVTSLPQGGVQIGNAPLVWTRWTCWMPWEDGGLNANYMLWHFFEVEAIMFTRAHISCVAINQTDQRVTQGTSLTGRNQHAHLFSMGTPLVMVRFLLLGTLFPWFHDFSLKSWVCSWSLVQVLGAFLFGARHPTWWPDAFRQDHRPLGHANFDFLCFAGLLLASIDSEWFKYVLEVVLALLAKLGWGRQQLILVSLMTFILRRSWTEVRGWIICPMVKRKNKRSVSISLKSARNQQVYTVWFFPICSICWIIFHLSLLSAVGGGGDDAFNTFLGEMPGWLGDGSFLRWLCPSSASSPPKDLDLLFHLTPQLEGLEKEQGHPTRTLSFNSSHVYDLRFFSETGAGKHVPRCVMVDLAPWQSLVGSRQGGGGGGSGGGSGCGGGGGDGDGDGDINVKNCLRWCLRWLLPVVPHKAVAEVSE